MCFGGSSADTDRGKILESYGDLEKSYDKLGGLSTDFLNSGKGLLNTGQEDTGTASNYFKGLISGDPTKLTAATAPIINTVTGEAENVS